MLARCQKHTVPYLNYLAHVLAHINNFSVLNPWLSLHLLEWNHFSVILLWIFHLIFFILQNIPQKIVNRWIKSISSFFCDWLSQIMCSNWNEIIYDTTKNFFETKKRRKGQRDTPKNFRTINHLFFCHPWVSLSLIEWICGFFMISFSY